MRKFRYGLVLGIAVGYVAGTAAGRQRYEQLRAAWQRVSASGPAQQLTGEVRDLASKAGERVEQQASEKVAKLTDSVRRGSDGAPGGRTADSTEHADDDPSRGAGGGDPTT